MLLVVALLAGAGLAVARLGRAEHAAVPRSRTAGRASTAAPALPAGSVYVAHAAVPRLAVYAAATGTQLVHELRNPIATGGPLVLLVRRDEGGARLQVDLPVRPNGSTGWVDRGDVALFSTAYRLVVDVSDRELVLSEGTGEGDHEVLRSPVAVGAPGTPTPLGHFFLTELLILPNPDGDYGPFAYGLSAHSEVLTEFNGGSGQAGLHGTNDPTSIGRAVSHGCVRLPNEVLRRIRALLPLGTPITIQP